MARVQESALLLFVSFFVIAPSGLGPSFMKRGMEFSLFYMCCSVSASFVVTLLWTSCSFLADDGDRMKRNGGMRDVFLHTKYLDCPCVCVSPPSTVSRQNE